MSTTETSNDAKKAGGYLKEKFTIGVSRVTGDEISRAIMKTTSHLLKAPNTKHLQRLIAATHGNYSPDAAKKHGNMCQYIVTELEKRSHTRNWIVVIKTMVTFHYMMIKGSDEVRKVMERNRNLFCMRNIKDVADSPDGAAQKVFIGQYVRYLEERNITQARIDVDSCRIENDDYLTMMKTMPDNILAAAMKQLLGQLDAVANLEFREVSVDNFATLEAYNLLINDGKCLYVILSNRMVYMLEKFDEMDVLDKQQWLNIYRRYSDVIHKLSVLFNALASARRHFSTPIPKLKEFPPSLLAKLEEEVEYSSIPKGTVVESGVPDPVPFTSILTAAASDFNNASKDGILSSSVGEKSLLDYGGEKSTKEADPQTVPPVDTEDANILNSLFINSSAPEKQHQKDKHAPSQINAFSANGTSINMDDLFGDTSPVKKQTTQWTDTAPNKNSNNSAADLFFDQNSNTHQGAWSIYEHKSNHEISIKKRDSSCYSDTSDHSSAFDPLEEDRPTNSYNQQNHINPSAIDLFSCNGFTDHSSPIQLPKTQEVPKQEITPSEQFDPFKVEIKTAWGGGQQQQSMGDFDPKPDIDSNPFYSFGESEQPKEAVDQNNGFDNFFR